MTDTQSIPGPDERPSLSELSTQQLEDLAYALAKNLAPRIALLEAIERELQSRPSIIRSPLVIP